MQGKLDTRKFDIPKVEKSNEYIGFNGREYGQGERAVSLPLVMIFESYCRLWNISVQQSQTRFLDTSPISSRKFLQRLYQRLEVWNGSHCRLANVVRSSPNRNHRVKMGGSRPRACHDHISYLLIGLGSSWP